MESHVCITNGVTNNCQATAGRTVLLFSQPAQAHVDYSFSARLDIELRSEWFPNSNSAIHATLKHLSIVQSSSIQTSPLMEPALLLNWIDYPVGAAVRYCREEIQLIVCW